MGKKLLLLVISALTYIHAEPPVDRRYLPPGQQDDNGYNYDRPGGTVGENGRREGGSEFDDPEIVDVGISPDSNELARLSSPSAQYGPPTLAGRLENFPDTPSSQYGAPAGVSSRFSAIAGPSSGVTNSRLSEFSRAPSAQYGPPSSARLTESGVPSTQYGAPFRATSTQNQFGSLSSSQSSLSRSSGLPLGQLRTPAQVSSQYNAPFGSSGKISDYSRIPSSVYGVPSGRLSSQTSPSSQYGVPNRDQVSRLTNSRPGGSVSADTEELNVPSSQYGTPSRISSQNGRTTSRVSIRIGGQTSNGNQLAQMSYTTRENGAPNREYGLPGQSNRFRTPAASQLNNGVTGRYASSGQLNSAPSRSYDSGAPISNGNNPSSRFSDANSYPQNARTAVDGLTSLRYLPPTRVGNDNGVETFSSSSPSPSGRLAENKGYSISSRSGQLNNIPSNNYGAPSQLNNRNGYTRNNLAEQLNNGNSYVAPTQNQQLNNRNGYTTGRAGQLNSSPVSDNRVQQQYNTAPAGLNNGNGYARTGALRQSSPSTQYGAPSRLSNSNLNGNGFPQSSRFSTPSRDSVSNGYARFQSSGPVNNGQSTQFGVPAQLRNGNGVSSSSRNAPSGRYGAPEELDNVESLNGRQGEPSRLSDSRPPVSSRQRAPDGLYGAPAVRTDLNRDSVEILGEEQSGYNSDGQGAADFRDGFTPNGRFEETPAPLELEEQGPY